MINWLSKPKFCMAQLEAALHCVNFLDLRHHSHILFPYIFHLVCECHMWIFLICWYGSQLWLFLNNWVDYKNHTHTYSFTSTIKPSYDLPPPPFFFFASYHFYPYIYCDCLDSDESCSTFSLSRFLLSFFFFFFPLHVNSNLTWVYCAGDKNHYLHTIHHCSQYCSRTKKY